MLLPVIIIIQCISISYCIFRPVNVVEEDNSQVMDDLQMSTTDPTLPLEDASLMVPVIPPAPPLPHRQVRFIPADPAPSAPDHDSVSSW